MRDFVALGEKKKRRIQILAFSQSGNSCGILLSREDAPASIWIARAIIKPRSYYREALLSRCCLAIGIKIPTNGEPRRSFSIACSQRRRYLGGDNA